MRTALRVLLARIRRRPLALEGPAGRFHLFPDGTIQPVMAGGDKTPEEEEAEQKAAELERAEAENAEAEARLADEEADPNSPKFKGTFDEERAKRLIANERARNERRLGKARAEADKARAEADKLKQEQETEQQRIARERDEATARGEQATARANRLAEDAAIREAAMATDDDGNPLVDPRKIKRLLKLVDRDDVEVDDDGEVDGAEAAVGAVLDEFPEFKGEAREPGEGDPPPKVEPAGGNPSRGKKPPKEMSADDARKLAKEDPEKFHELLTEGKLNGALAGK